MPTSRRPLFPTPVLLARGPVAARLVALAGLVALGASCGSEPTAADAEASPGDASATSPSAAAGAVATVTGISGPGGLTADDLPPGTFLGQGAILAAGQTVQTPRGTLAELQLADGTKIRLNEDTALVVPTAKWPRRLSLTRGEVVAVVATGSEPLEIAAGGETLSIAAGEAQVRNIGDGRRYAVVSGRASLQTPSKTLELGPGESLDAPLPQDTYDEAPALSLAALDDTAWTRTFASAARMSETVPRGVGSLTARRAGDSREQQRLRLTDQKITVNIAGRVAHTEIEQAFFNDRPEVLEGIYRFPLPSDGSISGLGLLVGNRWMEGEVLGKERARNIFKQIVDATIPRDPALLEWEQGNLFKLRIFPIPGRGDRRVRLSYTQVLPVVAGKLRYRFPMGGTGAGGTPIDDFAFTVNIDRSELDTQQLADIDTPMLALDRTLDGDTVRLFTAVKHFIPTSDLGIDVPLAAAAQQVHAVTHLDRDGQAYFMLALRPEFDTGRTEGPTNLAFVVDRSHSTTPELWTMAQGIVEAMASTLSADDRFTVLACDTACNRMPGGLLPTSSGAIADAGQFLADQDLAGASDVGAMMQAGADALVSAPSGERVVVYLGDGAPTSGELTPDALATTLRGPMQGTRVLAVALGARSDLTALGAVLDATGGEVVRADPRDDVRELVRDLSLRARVPMVRDLQIDLPDGMLMVRKQGDSGLRKDDTLLITGKLSHPVSGQVRVRGRGVDGPLEASFPVALSATRPDGAAASVHQHLPRTWAQMQIAHLTKTKGFAAHDEIVKLSQDYTVLSRFTAMLVLENDAMFREFNVVRRENDKDRWDGSLPPPEAAGSARPVEEEVTTASKDTLGEDGGPRKAGGGESGEADKGSLGNARANQDPAPPSTPEPEPDFFGPADEETRQAPPAAEPVPGASPFGGAASRDQRRSADGDDDEADDVSAALDMPATKADAAPREKAKKVPAPSPKPSSTSTGASNIPWGSGEWGGPVPPANRRSRSWQARVPTLRIAGATTPSSRALDRIDDLARQVSRDPTKRSAHGQLVRAAIFAGHPNATEFARAWAEVDPEHPPALLTLADMLAAAGDPMASRAYESAVEVRPFDAKQHEALAEGLAGKGDLVRACSHRHAVVSIAPSQLDNHAALIRCLAESGRADDARRALLDARTRAQGKATTLARTFATLDAELARTAAPPEIKLHSAAELRATVSWSGEDELDVVVVDNRGSRLSALRPAGKVRVQEGRGTETLTMRKVKKSVFVEVTRLGDGTDDELSRAIPVSGTLTLRTAGGRTKTIPFTMRGGTLRLAKVFWSR